MSDVYTDLKKGTFLRCGKTRIRLSEDMRGDWAHVDYVRKDGQRVQNRIGWSGCLSKDEWTIEDAPSNERFAKTEAFIEEDNDAQVRRASGWSQPEGADKGRACFLALGTSETCINCGEHVSRHYDDHAKSKALHYFCVKRDESKGITGRSKRSLRRLIKDLLKHLISS